MSRARRITVWAATALVLVLLAGAAWGTWTVRRSFPQTTGETVAIGLERPVEVLRDESGIAQIYADTAHDLFFTQGYVHAQDRFYEMDFRRHVVAGRLAELVGDSALETDVYVRSLGWYDVASEELAELDAASRAYLQAYADGVNSYLDGRTSSELSLEYAALGLTGHDYAPDPWTPTDSLAWLKALAWDLRSNMDDEIARVLASTVVSPSEVEELYPDYPVTAHQPILDRGAVVSGRFEPRARPRSAAARPPPLGPAVRGAVAPRLRAVAQAGAAVPELLGTGDGIGSNSWVVSGEHTSSGAPLLANDPHLEPAMPGIWAQMGLHCRAVGPRCPFDVSGATFSGVPGVVIGHNDRVAWGLTTMYADVTDLYVERLDGDRYLFDGRWVEMRVREEEFEIAGESATVTRTVRATRHGPLLSDVDDDAALAAGEAPLPHPPDEGDDYGVALQWTALEPGRTMDALFAMNSSRSWSQFRAAARLFAVPSQNLVYADVDGHIGYQAPGQIPVRRLGDGRWPVPGWDARYGWRGMIPFRQLPWVLDPPRGVIVTANQAVVDPAGYPYELGADTAYGYRSQRILDLLATRDDWTLPGTLELQTDTLHPMADRLLPLLLRTRLGSGYQREGQQELVGWDGSQPPGSGPAAYFNAVWAALLEQTFADQLPEEAWPEGGERWFAVVERLLRHPASVWWDDIDTDRVEDRDDVVAGAMMQARDDLTAMVAEDPGRWSWGALHRLELENATLGRSGVGVVEALFNRGAYELGGGPGSVDAVGWDASEGFEVTSVPTLRMAVPLDDLDAARWVVLGGSSGHAFSSHYNDQTDVWAEGQTVEWPFTPEAVEAAASDRLVLVPQD